ncbi:MAG: hypothetical protein QOE91_1128 [Gaiellaceae bacterium]|jgi:hypothetical protein|nr:hypothetical protein [Gaiellaceae bacterium]
MDGEHKRGDRLRSFLIGGAVGASAALAAARRRRPRRTPRQTPAGLAAFEGAPCFTETLRKEAERKN